MDDALRPGSGIVIPVSEIQWRFSASSGPGGQHANTSNTRVEARLDLANSPSLDEHHRARLVARLGPEVRVVCQTERSQTRNRSLALDRLEERLAVALVLKRSRRPTRATRGSQKRRLDSKSQRADVKRNRRRPSADD